MCCPLLRNLDRRRTPTVEVLAAYLLVRVVYPDGRGKEKISWPNKDGRRYTAKFKSQVVLEALRSQKPDAVRVP